MHEDKSLDQILSSQLSDKDSNDDIDSELLLKAIQSRVSHLLEFQPDLLFSYLYRLDVSESKVRLIIETDLVSDKVGAISELILQRQLLRFKSKKELPQPPIDGWQW